MSGRPSLRKNKRVVLKIGSSVIASHDKGLDEERLAEIAEEVAALRAEGRELFLVSSGAVLCGMEKLGLKRRPTSIPMKQAAAAVGQSRLMWAYEKFFERFQIKVAQVLLTREDIADRKRFINARNTLMTLLDRRVLPIINENDTVTIDEIKFGDNDHLAGQITHLVDASLLIILSDVDGLFQEDPRKNPGAALIPLVEEVTPEIEKMAGGAGPHGGTGGMGSKVRTAKQVAAYGGTTLILNGTARGIIKRAFQGETVGTLFLPRAARLSSKKHWIAHSLKVKGEMVLDPGAVEAILKNGKSLLPSGVRSIEGKFEVGDAVRLLSNEGKEIAKGLTNYSASEMIQIKGIHSSQIEKALGYKSTDEVIHRDNLVVTAGVQAP
ncbi:MAG TPA: glutamate 5-kinase [Candidatus Manganitrophaceae bacterium]|nr:glutamate 5-kinase [Candidatus Manganitrophaceae bacterium]